jgi:membrane protein DedA with SNARE-associated domain/rhodanese-related sulfurtransferase
LDELTQFLIRHGGLVVFAIVFAEQVGLPIPAFPILLAAGALAGAGKMNLALAIVLAFMACLMGDLLWYYLGRYRGAKVLGLLCRISLEPDSCVRRTEEFFLRHGTRSLVFAKFLPGLSTVTPALAGLFGVKVERFMLYDGLGAFLWVAAATVPGYLFSDQLESMAAQAGRLGSSVVVLLMTVVALYVAFKYVNRQRVLRELRIARISVDELKEMMDKGPQPVIVDLRPLLPAEVERISIPGALRMSVEELERRHHEIPRDRDVVLFCACPNEITAARMALLLRKNGITRVRPLAGGVEAWHASASKAGDVVRVSENTIPA